ncbi:MAG TPA: hypothetical protein VLU41_07360, partial [Ideonella sp.]|nr:hypothetical protein [Ideonella sp.]
SIGKYTRFADAQRVRYWLETGGTLAMAKAKRGHVVKVKSAHTRAKPRYATRAKSPYIATASNSPRR